jgi:hypothetical protein
MTDIEAETLRAVREHLVTAETQLIDNLSSTFRWLMGTLFAANGGAIIALMGSDNVNLSGNTAALRWFAIGLVLSILIGIASAFAAYRTSLRITTLKFRVVGALIEGQGGQQVLADIAAQKTSWKTWTPSYVGIASFLCLIAGMIMIACCA